jgi:uncharacterized protein with PIN domain
LIVVDTSAFVAAILSEEDGPGYAAAGEPGSGVLT